jgi:hypothetical protein
VGTEQLTFEHFGLSLLDTWIHVNLHWLLCKQNRDRVVCNIKDVPLSIFYKMIDHSWRESSPDRIKIDQSGAENS